MPKLTKGLKTLATISLTELEAIEAIETRKAENGEKTEEKKPVYPKGSRSIRSRRYLDPKLPAPKYALLGPRFVRSFARHHCSVTKACQECKITYDTYYDWLKRHQEFADAIEYAKFGYLDYLDDRLEDYVEQEPLNATRLTATIAKLKAKHPDYRRPLEVDLSSTITGLKGLHHDEAIDAEVDTKLRALGIIEDVEFSDPTATDPTPTDYQKT